MKKLVALKVPGLPLYFGKYVSPKVHVLNLHIHRVWVKKEMFRGHSLVRVSVARMEWRPLGWQTDICLASLTFCIPSRGKTVPSPSWGHSYKGSLKETKSVGVCTVNAKLPELWEISCYCLCNLRYFCYCSTDRLSFAGMNIATKLDVSQEGKFRLCGYLLTSLYTEDLI